MRQSKDPVLLKFGAVVRARRTALGLSQEDLAHLSELDRTYIGGVERGERNVSLINIDRIAKALKTKPERLLEGLGTE
jgi:transcriptional regulator with XRE-family HTH domain